MLFRNAGDVLWMSKKIMEKSTRSLGLLYIKKKKAQIIHSYPNFVILACENANKSVEQNRANG